MGDTEYYSPLYMALRVLQADSANVKKVVFMTDGQEGYPSGPVRMLKSEGIIVDTVAFGFQYSQNFGALERIARDTGGSYTRVSPRR